MTTINSGHNQQLLVPNWGDFIYSMAKGSLAHNPEMIDSIELMLERSAGRADGEGLRALKKAADDFKADTKSIVVMSAEQIEESVRHALYVFRHIGPAERPHSGGGFWPDILPERGRDYVLFEDLARRWGYVRPTPREISAAEATNMWILNLPSVDWRKVLCGRASGLNWSEIAGFIGCHTSTAQRYHKKAILHIQRALLRQARDGVEIQAVMGD